MYSLEAEERDTSRHDRKIADDDNDDYEVTGLMCDSDDDDGDCDVLEVESETVCFGCCGRLVQFHRNPAHVGEGNFKLYGHALDQFEDGESECDYM